ncbi:hypothetical protein OKW38_001886 [Paraburkholderia sp. MM5496-R1]|uniref:hypothetical protein n=1 Tax=Paraburkholderia sp. MM5496-R1 TaxID=2991065 RepID=UPI003D1E64C1
MGRFKCSPARQIDDRTATLTCKVASDGERRLVYGAAKAAPGVRTLVSLPNVE